MDNNNSELIVNKISKELINDSFDIAYRGENEVSFSNKNIMFEQYKLLIDSAHKIEERRGTSTTIFIGINTMLVSVLANSYELLKIELPYMPFFASLSFIGILISYDWIKVMNSYKTLNFLNYAIIHSFENLLPTYVFSLRAKLATEQPEQSEQKIKNRGSSVLMNETLLPKVFLSIYSIYFLAVVIVIFYKLQS